MSEFAGQFVVAVSLLKAGRSENSHARAVELKTFEAVQKFEKESHRALEIFPPFPVGPRERASLLP